MPTLPKPKRSRRIWYLVGGVVVLAAVVIWYRKKAEKTASAQGTGELVAVEPSGTPGAGAGAGEAPPQAAPEKGEPGEPGAAGEAGQAGTTIIEEPLVSPAVTAAVAAPAAHAQATASKAAFVAPPHRTTKATSGLASTSFYTGTYKGKTAHIHSGPVPGGVGPGHNIVIVETAHPAPAKPPPAVFKPAPLQQQPSRAPAVTPVEAAHGIVPQETVFGAPGGPQTFVRVGAPTVSPDYTVGTYRGKRAHFHTHPVPGGVGPGHNIVIV